jgi:hypothetical protein
MFTDEELKEVRPIVDGLLDGNRGVYPQRHPGKGIQGIMAIIMSLLAQEAQSRGVIAHAVWGELNQQRCDGDCRCLHRFLTTTAAPVAVHLFPPAI